VKIAIDSGPLNSGHSIRGVGAYTRELINALKGKVEAVDFRSADLSKYDLIHYPYFSSFQRTLPLNKSTKTVVTIHDLIPLIYPKHYPPGIKGNINLFFQKLALRNVDAIVTDTETSKKDIVRFLDIPPQKIHVVYLAPREIFKKVSDLKKLENIRKKYNLPKKFVLYVGDINYNKNIPNLIKACKIANLPLVICGKQAMEIDGMINDMKSIKGPRDFLRFLTGKPHPELSHYNQILKNLDFNVHRLGYVSDEDLVCIYNLATLYCQPSLYEGFGLPVLESLACGTPVFASKTQALVEIAERAVNFFDPHDTKDIAKSFDVKIKNPKLPREYSWGKTAKETMDVYAKA
jgi:glycosyltransferase involved in cell wall biosynthesis